MHLTDMDIDITYIIHVNGLNIVTVEPSKDSGADGVVVTS